MGGVDITEWYADTVAGATENAVAQKADINQSTLNRQLRAGRLSPELVIPIARAYGADVLDALVVVGLITPDDIRAHGARAALDAATDQEIGQAIMRRLERSSGPHPALDAQLGQ